MIFMKHYTKDINVLCLAFIEPGLTALAKERSWTRKIYLDSWKESSGTVRINRR